MIRGQFSDERFKPESDQVQAGTPPACRPSVKSQSRRHLPYAVLVLALLVFGLGYGAVAWRLDQAPDLFTDEILYTRTGIRVATEGAMVWDYGEPVWVHPPVYFLVEAVYLKLTSVPASWTYAPGDIFAWVYHARYLNAILAGLTAVLLLVIGWRLRGLRLGVLLAALFILDPFGVRTNRRAMLETLAVLFMLGGMAVLLLDRGAGGWRAVRRAVGAGVLFGLALLTKELAFTALLSLLLLGVWELWLARGSDRLARSAPFIAAVVALSAYNIYLLWALTSGDLAGFFEVKFLTFKRLMGLVQISGWNRPGVSVFSFLQTRIADYGSTLLLLALGGLATAWLFIAYRHERAGRLLGVWGLVLYPFYAFITLFAAGHDQFFYFLLVHAIVMVGYVLFTAPAQGQSWVPWRRLRASGLENMFKAGGAWFDRKRMALAILLASVILPYNLMQWAVSFGIGVDNAYYQLVRYVHTYLPADGGTIYTSGDEDKFHYFFPDRPISNAGSPEAAIADRIRYFALSSKDVWARYGHITPGMAAWIKTNGKRLVHFVGNSYGDIYFYRVDYAEGTAPATGPGTTSFYRAYRPARTGFVAGFVVGLSVWGLLIAGLLMGLGRRRSKRRPWAELVQAGLVSARRLEGKNERA